MNPKDKRLGMDRAITRRDFLNGTALAIGSLAFSGNATLLKSIQTESQPSDISRADTRLATTAFISRAPSICVMSLFFFAIVTISSRSDFFQTVPPPIFAVC